MWFERPQELTVVIGTPSSRARSAIVPNLPMMSDAVIPHGYDMSRFKSIAPTNSVVDIMSLVPQAGLVLDTDELLARLEARGVRNIEIAKALGLPDSRVPEIRQKRRRLSLDEGAKLARTFALEPDQALEPLPASIVRLIVRYLAQELQASAPEGQLHELTEDVRAFALFAADPKVRTNVEAVETFFQAMRFRRPKDESKTPSESDPARQH